MPTYTYRCGNCGAQFDRKQSFDEAALRTCPECGEPRLRKLFTPVGIVFKGPGFYSTDHGLRNNGEAKSEPKEKGEAGTSAEKPTKKPPKKAAPED